MIEDAWRDLSEYLTGDDLGPGEVDDLTLAAQDDATRAGRKLGSLERHEAELVAAAQAERDRIDAWLADRRAGIVSERERLVRALEGFMRMSAARDGMTSIALPTVSLSLRKDPDRIEGDVDVEFAAARPTLVRVRPVEYALDKVAAKKALTPGPVTGTYAADGAEVHSAVDPETGEVIEGITFLVPPERTFRWKLTTGEAEDR